MVICGPLWTYSEQEMKNEMKFPCGEIYVWFCPLRSEHMEIMPIACTPLAVYGLVYFGLYKFWSI